VVVTCETSGVARMMCWSDSSPAGCTPIQIAVILLDMSDHFSLLQSHSISGVLLMARG
jgi:hypothetical protein